MLFDECGNPCTVTYVSEDHWLPCYEVAFSDGTALVCDEEHQWLVWDKPYRKSLGRRVTGARRAWPVPSTSPKVLQTKELYASVMYGDEYNYSIPTCGPIELPTKNLPIDPYTLGLWLGDGSRCGGEICAGDAEVELYVRTAGFVTTWYKTKSGRVPVFGVRGLRKLLKENNLWKNKHVPLPYLRSSQEQRRQLLYGLMDSDGYCSPSGTVEFCNTNKDIAESVLDLMCGLGIKASMSEGRATLYGKDCGPKYRITASPTTPVFRLTRKLNQQVVRKWQSPARGYRFIRSVKHTPTVVTRCLQVDSPSHMFLCSRSYIPTHNTRSAAEFVRSKIENGQAGRVAFIAATAADARDTMVEGESGILEISRPDFAPKYEPSKRRITWPNGAIATTYSAEEPRRLRGPQHDLCWCDEYAAWVTGSAAFDQMQFGLRLGKDPRTVVTTTPARVPFLKPLLEDPTTVVTRETTYANLANLAPSYQKKIISRYEGTRLGRQELEGLLLEDVEGALWSLDNIEETRVGANENINFVRIVVAVDPSTTAGGDECGVLVAGLAGNGHAYVLADYTVQGGPEKWAKRAVAAYDAFEELAPQIRMVAEANQGGEMVQAMFKLVEDAPKVTLVYATKGKYIRAEPVSMLYEQGRVHHRGFFSKLEDELTSWVPGQPSPNRLDALVWACHDLFNIKPKSGRGGYFVPDEDTGLYVPATNANNQPMFFGDEGMGGAGPRRLIQPGETKPLGSKYLGSVIHDPFDELSDTDQEVWFSKLMDTGKKRTNTEVLVELLKGLRDWVA